MIDFSKLGCDEAVRESFDTACASLARDDRRFELGRVVSLDRGYPLVRTRGGESRAELAASVKKSADGAVAVGDWVVLGVPESHEKAIVAGILPRKSELARVKRVGRERVVRRQVLAANVDVVFICQSLTGEGIDERLLVRQMAAVMGSGARAVFVLTKSDLVSADAARWWMRRIAELAPDVPCVLASRSEALSRPAESPQLAGSLRQPAPPEPAAPPNLCQESHFVRSPTASPGQPAPPGPADPPKPATSLVPATPPGPAAPPEPAAPPNLCQESHFVRSPTADALCEFCPAGTTGLLLGESGVGKSTLANELVGEGLLATGAVRATDDRGRHTTVARRMVDIPGAGVIIDAPGLRTLQIEDVERCLAAAFPDIADAATRCRFADCTHRSEPDCAVRAEIPRARLWAWRTLTR